ncbi:hypothetical protein EIP86_001934 [Pleurotus ostreatoroseus]|nr:hypothetical protein EIP86_001934 [Pleurotus ostreatoroseus]
MAVNPNEDTEFNDILRKHGILPPRPETPPSPSPPPSPTLEDKLSKLTTSQLKDAADDAFDEETEQIIRNYHKERDEQLKRLQHARFGRVYPISREDYTREVTEASKVDAEDADAKGKGTGVVCFLYKDGIPRSDRTFEQIRMLAERYPHTKFVSIVGDKCIPNLPDTRIPMLIIYRKGEIVNQIIAWGADRERKLEELEAVLILAGAIIPQPRPPRDEDADEGEDDLDDDDDASIRRPAAATMTNGKPAKNIRGKSAKDDDDSDFEFDL